MINVYRIPTEQLVGTEIFRFLAYLLRSPIVNHCRVTAKNIRRFYDKITGNQLPVHFLFLLSPINIFSGMRHTLKEINGLIDKYLVILSSN